MFNIFDDRDTFIDAFVAHRDAFGNIWQENRLLVSVTASMTNNDDVLN